MLVGHVCIFGDYSSCFWWEICSHTYCHSSAFNVSFLCGCFNISLFTMLILINLYMVLFYLRLGSLSFLKICVYSFRKFLPTISSIFFPLLFFRNSNCSYIRLLNAVSQVTNIFSNYFFCVSFWRDSIAISSKFTNVFSCHVYSLTLIPSRAFFISRTNNFYL